MVDSVVSIEFVLELFIRDNLTEKQKKPTWRNTRRYSTTSAYSSTSRPARPGCSLYSHPKTSPLSLRRRPRKFHASCNPCFLLLPRYGIDGRKQAHSRLEHTLVGST